MNDLSLSIMAEPFDSSDARRLIAALDAALTELYPPAQRFGPNLKAAHLASGRGTFLVARDSGRAVGCGAIRLLDPTTAEVKRIYVEPDRRGSGVGGPCWPASRRSPDSLAHSALCSRRAFTR